MIYALWRHSVIMVGNSSLSISSSIILCWQYSGGGKPRDTDTCLAIQTPPIETASEAERLSSNIRTSLICGTPWAHPRTRICQTKVCKSFMLFLALGHRWERSPLCHISGTINFVTQKPIFLPIVLARLRKKTMWTTWSSHLWHHVDRRQSIYPKSDMRGCHFFKIGWSSSET